MGQRLLLLFTFLFVAGSTSYAATPVDTNFITPFERSKGKQTATYAEMVSFYKKLGGAYNSITLGDLGPSEIVWPIRFVAFSKEGGFKRDEKHEDKLIMLINNDIHPGEPDGVDATMMLLRDAAQGKIQIPDNLILVVIPMYNVGGAFNRNSTSRVNQVGPEVYGFRGSARNFDLNRDFIKCDAAETVGLETFFTTINPDIFIDNHVSDGADYQHIMTLLEPQADKMGGEAGALAKNTLTPALYKDMKGRGYDMVPYVNDFNNTPENGWRQFYESPRYSGGYASLYQTISYVPEAHMLKPFNERVRATYALMQSFIKVAGENVTAIKTARANDRAALLKQKEFPLDWRVDTTQADSVTFKGYKAGYKTSEVSGLQRLYYDRSKPYTKKVPYYNHLVPTKKVTAPQAYIIPKQWTQIISCLRTNNVRMFRFNYDSTVTVTAYHIDNYETADRPYEKHYPHKNVQVTPKTQTMRFSEGDYIIWLNQPARRYLIETLEPTAPDGFFVWNFFDAILQQKEYFSSYVFEDVAADLLKKDPALKAMLEEKRKADSAFANDAHAQLDFVYKHSPYLEPEYLRYPVYRLE